jgi:hypothetical protein
VRARNLFLFLQSCAGHIAPNAGLPETQNKYVRRIELAGYQFGQFLIILW